MFVNHLPEEKIAGFFYYVLAVMWLLVICFSFLLWWVGRGLWHLVKYFMLFPAFNHLTGEKTAGFFYYVQAVVWLLVFCVSSLPR